jgi:hypothetical protein
MVDKMKKVYWMLEVDPVLFVSDSVSVKKKRKV